jgi:hypothetical protein
MPLRCCCLQPCIRFYQHAGLRLQLEFDFREGINRPQSTCYTHAYPEKQTSSLMMSQSTKSCQNPRRTFALERHDDLQVVTKQHSK